MTAATVKAPAMSCQSFRSPTDLSESSIVDSPRKALVRFQRF
jgi:hypothetical protein